MAARTPRDRTQASRPQGQLQRKIRWERMAKTQLGSVAISSQPNERTDKVDEAEKGAVHRIEAGKDAAKVLELVDTAFDEMTFAVEPRVVVALDLGALVRRNDRFTVPRLQVGDEVGAGVAAIRHPLLEGQPAE